MSPSSPLLDAAPINSMSSRAKSFLNDGGQHRGQQQSPTIGKTFTSSSKKKRGLRSPLAFLSSPFQGQNKAVSHVKLDDGSVVDQIKNELAILQHEVRELNQSYKHRRATTTARVAANDSSCSGDDSDDDSDRQTNQDGAKENFDSHSRQLDELNRKLLQIQAGLVAIDGERCQLLSRGKQAEQQIETLEDELSSKDTQIHLLREENLKLRQQSLCRDESGPHNLRQWKQKYDTLSGNFVTMSEKLAKTTNRVANMEFEKKALVSLNQALQAKVLRAENRTAQETENMKEVLRHNANQLADLEDLLKEKSKLIDVLGDRLASKECSEAATMQSLTSYHDRKLQFARRQHEADIQTFQHHHKQQINALGQQLSEKSAEYEAMRREFDSQMLRLMSATAEIDRFKDERAKMEGMAARLESLNRECEDYKEILFAKDTKIAILRADNMKKDLEMKYVTTPCSNNTYHPTLGRLASSPEHVVAHVVTPLNSLAGRSEMLGFRFAENDYLEHEEKLSHADDTPAACATVTCLHEESFDWAIETMTDESRFANSP